MASGRIWIHRLRIYESIQGLVPAAAGFMGAAGMRGLLARPGGAAFLVCAFIHQLLIYTYNDACDFDSDLLNPRRRVGYPNPLSKASLLSASLTLLVPSLLLLAALPAGAAVALALALALCLAYSAPWTKWKSVPGLGRAVHLAFGALSFVGGALAAGVRFEHLDFFAACYFAMLYLSGGLFNQLLDHDYDPPSAYRVAKPRIFVQVLGAQFCALLCLAGGGNRLASGGAAFLLVICYGVWVATRGPRGYGQTELLEFRKNYRIFFGLVTAVGFFYWA